MALGLYLTSSLLCPSACTWRQVFRGLSIWRSTSPSSIFSCLKGVRLSNLQIVFDNSYISKEIIVIWNSWKLPDIVITVVGFPSPYSYSHLQKLRTKTWMEKCFYAWRSLELSAYIKRKMQLFAKETGFVIERWLDWVSRHTSPLWWRRKVEDACGGIFRH